MAWSVFKQARPKSDPPPPFSVDFNQYLVNGQKWESCTSWLRPEHVQKIGLPAASVITVMLRRDGPFDATNVRSNPAFPDFLQSCMHAIVERSTVLASVAGRVTDGLLAIPDGRAFDPWSEY